MSARVAPAAESASWRRGNFAYFTRTVAGLEYEQFCRRPAGAVEPGGRGAGARGRGAARSEPAAAGPGVRRRVRGARRARGQPRRRPARLLGRLRRRRGLPAADQGPGQRHGHHDRGRAAGADRADLLRAGLVGGLALAVLRRDQRRLPGVPGLAARHRHRSRPRTCWCSPSRTSASTSSCGRPAAARTSCWKPKAGTPPRRSSSRPRTPARHLSFCGRGGRGWSTGPITPTARAGASSTWSPTTRRPSSGSSGARCRARATRRSRTAGTR